VNDHLRRRYLGDQPQAIYLIRPDQVVAARWISAKADEITAAMAAAWGA
jgi:3-(3-hydroxy-phenyl)propionate hydroxylase